MLVLNCPTCKTRLIEESKNKRIDCLNCSDEFDFKDGEYHHMSFTEVFEAMIKINPEKLIEATKELGLQLDILTKRQTVKSKILKKVEQSIRNTEKENEVAVENNIAAQCGREAYLNIMRKIKGDDEEEL